MTHDPDRDSPDILVFPPLASIIAPLAAIALGWAIPFGLLPPAFGLWSTVLGIVIMVLAGALAFGGARAFKAAGTNVNPRSPALRLVETGPYRLTSNPMYLGMVILQIGLAFAFSLDWALIAAPVLWVVLHYGVVLREEAYLTAKFGAPYEEYLQRTRRWH